MNLLPENSINFNGFAGVWTTRFTSPNSVKLLWTSVGLYQVWPHQISTATNTDGYVRSIDFVITKWTRTVPLSSDQADSCLGNECSPGGGGVLGGAGVMGGGVLLGGGLTPICWSIQLRNLDTRANTENRSFAEHLGDPQLTAPCSTQRSAEFWHTYGPPLSPWQPLKMVPSSPAHSIWSVMVREEPPVGTITMDERRTARKSVALRNPHKCQLELETKTVGRRLMTQTDKEFTENNSIWITRMICENEDCQHWAEILTWRGGQLLGAHVFGDWRHQGLLQGVVCTSWVLDLTPTWRDWMFSQCETIQPERCHDSKDWVEGRQNKVPSKVTRISFTPKLNKYILSNVQEKEVM